jgi:hypothetical protein
MELAWRLAALIALLLAAPASALSVSFTKIADASAPGPGWAPNVYFGAPGVDAGVVAFHAVDLSTGSFGIYTGSGGALTTVADTTTPIPGGSGAFSGFTNPSISAGNVAFYGWGPPDYLGGVYASLGGGLSEIVDYGDPAPGGGGPLNLDAGMPSIHGTSVAFGAYTGASPYAIYTSVAGVLELTADESTLVPGGAGSLFLRGPVSLDATGAAFDAFSGSVAGIYVADAGVVRVVADTATPIPGGTGNFTSFDRGPASDSGNVAFEGLGSDTGGIYAEIAGSLVVVTDTEFVFYSEGERGLSVSGDAVAYHGSDGFTIALYLYRGGQREVVIASGDLLDGRVVSGFRFGQDGLSGDQLAFTAFYEDGTSAVYLANIPEPGTALLLAAGLLALGTARRFGLGLPG